MLRSRRLDARRLLSEHPWFISQPAMDAIIERLEAGVAAGAIEGAAGETAAARRTPAPAATPGSIAVLPLTGPIDHRESWFTEWFGGTAVDSWGRAFDALVADPNIAAIVLDVESPGGSVFGIEELGDKIFAARAQKPIIAVANAYAASAGYWLACQASELVVTPSGQVGSIGVLCVHQDISKMADQLGVKVTFVHAGRFKVEGNPFEPLGDEARARLQAEVDVYYAAFVRAVARGRGVSQTAVRENFGEGRMVLAAEAVRLGMADREGTLQETLGRLTARQAKPGARAEGEPPAVEAAAEPEPVAATEEIDERDRLRLRAAELAAASFEREK